MYLLGTYIYRMWVELDRGVLGVFLKTAHHLKAAVIIIESFKFFSIIIMMNFHHKEISIADMLLARNMYNILLEKIWLANQAKGYVTHFQEIAHNGIEIERVEITAPIVLHDDI